MTTSESDLRNTVQVKSLKYSQSLVCFIVLAIAASYASKITFNSVLPLSLQIESTGKYVAKLRAIEKRNLFY